MSNGTPNIVVTGRRGQTAPFIIDLPFISTAGGLGSFAGLSPSAAAIAQQLSPDEILEEITTTAPRPTPPRGVPAANDPVFSILPKVLARGLGVIGAASYIAGVLDRLGQKKLDDAWRDVANRENRARIERIKREREPREVIITQPEAPREDPEIQIPGRIDIVEFEVPQEVPTQPPFEAGTIQVPPEIVLPINPIPPDIVLPEIPLQPPAVEPLQSPLSGAEIVLPVGGNVVLPVPGVPTNPLTRVRPRGAPLPNVTPRRAPRLALDTLPQQNPQRRRCCKCKKDKEEVRTRCFKKLVRESRRPSDDESYEWEQIDCDTGASLANLARPTAEIFKFPTIGI